MNRDRSKAPQIFFRIKFYIKKINIEMQALSGISYFLSTSPIRMKSRGGGHDGRVDKKKEIPLRAFFVLLISLIRLKSRGGGHDGSVDKKWEIPLRAFFVKLKNYFFKKSTGASCEVAVFIKSIQTGTAAVPPVRRCASFIS